VDRDLLVQDTHVHMPMYAVIAACLSVIALGLAIPRWQPVHHRCTFCRALARLRRDVAHETRLTTLCGRHARGRLGDGSGIRNCGRVSHLSNVVEKP